MRSHPGDAQLGDGHRSLAEFEVFEYQSFSWTTRAPVTVNRNDVPVTELGRSTGTATVALGVVRSVTAGMFHHHRLGPRARPSGALTVSWVGTRVAAVGHQLEIEVRHRGRVPEARGTGQPGTGQMAWLKTPLQKVARVAVEGGRGPLVDRALEVGR